MELGPDLIDTLLPGGTLLKRAEEVTSADTAWLQALRELVERKAALPPDASLQQGAVFNQVTRVLGAAAKQRPLLVVLESFTAEITSATLIIAASRSRR